MLRKIRAILQLAIYSISLNVKLGKFLISPPSLSNIFLTNFRDGITSQGSEFINHEIVSTPLIHYFVHRTNFYKPEDLSDNYYSTVSNGFINFVKKFPETQHVLKKKLVFDCANGVGYKVLSQYLERFGDKFPLEIVPINDNFEKLNEGCGSDFVHNKKTYPSGFEEFSDGAIGACLDGDGDRSIL